MESYFLNFFFIASINILIPTTKTKIAYNMAISFTEEIQPIYQNNAQIPEKIVRVSNISIILFFMTLPA